MFFHTEIICDEFDSPLFSRYSFPDVIPNLPERNAMSLKGVIFDMDGTVVDVPYDWTRIKSELGTRGRPILSYIASLPEPEKSRKKRILEKHEERATAQAVLKDGMKSFIDFLHSNRMKTALVTNNSRKNVSFLINKYDLHFDSIISREQGLWKPEGTPFLAVMKKWGLEKNECCVIGDSMFDVLAAENAGIESVYLLGMDLKDISPDRAAVCRSVEELKKRISILMDAGI